MTNFRLKIIDDACERLLSKPTNPLTEWEREFVTNIKAKREQGFNISDKMFNRLQQISLEK